MRRHLTGYAVYFNHRHRGSGQLFQNRYKSILCQEDAYLTELVRYIHLNPFRAGLVKSLEELNKHPYRGHGVLMGNKKREWQDVDCVLNLFRKAALPCEKTILCFCVRGNAFLHSFKRIISRASLLSPE